MYSNRPHRSRLRPASLRGARRRRAAPGLGMGSRWSARVGVASGLSDMKSCSIPGRGRGQGAANHPWDAVTPHGRSHMQKPVSDYYLQTHTRTRLTALCPGLSGWAGTRKVKPIWILLKQETVSGSDISWAICKSAPRSRQITTPAPHRSVF